MTHDELLEKIGTMITIEAKINKNDADTLMATAKKLSALRAVVELHKPTGWFEDTGYADQECIHCDNGSYPCPTIQAIEKELK